MAARHLARQTMPLLWQSPALGNAGGETCRANKNGTSRKRWRARLSPAFPSDQVTGNNSMNKLIRTSVPAALLAARSALVKTTMPTATPTVSAATCVHALPPAEVRFAVAQSANFCQPPRRRDRADASGPVFRKFNDEEAIFSAAANSPGEDGHSWYNWLR
jgi:hypothetical protein